MSRATTKTEKIADASRRRLDGLVMPGVWCCEHQHKCKWQGFALHQGLAWGTIPDEHNTWRQWHDRECGGKLIQLIDKA